MKETISQTCNNPKGYWLRSSLVADFMASITLRVRMKRTCLKSAHCRSRAPFRLLSSSRDIGAVILKNTHTHPFNGPLSGTTRVSQYQKGKTNLDFSEAKDSEWQWHRLDHMQVCTSLQTDNHANTSLLSFLQAGCPSCRPTNSVKALKALILKNNATNTCFIHYN